MGVTNGQIEIAKEVLQKVYDNLNKNVSHCLFLPPQRELFKRL
jgi:hypothetical protein